MSARPLRGALKAGALLAVLTATLLSPQAYAGLFDDTEARQQINQLRQRLDAAQGTIDGLSRNQLDFANQMDALRAEMAKLNGALEVLKYELESTQKRQQDFYVDLDNRLRRLEPQAAANPEAAGTATAPAPAAAPAVADTVAYEKAVTALKAGKSKEAGAAFDGFIAAYPQSKLLGSAYYWNGYAHSQIRDYKTAAALFGRFAEGWPDDPRAPDALESEAESLTAAKDTKGAQAVLMTLVEKYPNSEAGKRARQQLKKK